MKKFKLNLRLCFLSIVLSGSSLFQSEPASAYSRILDNTTWLSTINGMEGYENALWERMNDTVINSVVCTKVRRTYISLPGVFTNPYIGGSHDLFFHEDTIAKTFSQWFGFQFITLFDWNLNLGDSLHSGFGYILSTIDSVLTNAGWRQRFVFTDTTPWPIVWIEGIGNIAEPFEKGRVFSSTFATLLCVHSNGSLVYEFTGAIPVQCGNYTGLPEAEADQLMIYPNPFSDIVRFDGIELPAMIEIYNPVGRLVERCEIRNVEHKYFPFLKPGVYVFKMIRKNGYYLTKRMIKR